VPQELRDRVPRFGHGSRVPGWDDAADLSKAPQEVPDLATTPVPDDLRAELEGHMAKYPDRRSAALPCLAAAQRLHGWCSPEAITQTAAVMRLTPAYLVSVASFYDMLDTRPIGRHRVYVCTNISCSLNGGREVYERLAEHVGDDSDIQVRHFECLGACDIAPMASVDGVYVGPLEMDELPQLVEQIRAGDPPLPAKQLRRRKSADPRANSQDFPAYDETSVDRRAHLASSHDAEPVRRPDQGVVGDMPGDPPGPSAPIEDHPT
jgi:NADH:ubiquinone oxidoreductase subunit E